MSVSIRSRLLSFATIILIAFLGLTGVALNRGYHDSAETALNGRLQAHVYTLLAAAELTVNNALELPPSLPEPRFESPDSGLIAFVTDDKGKLIWRSRSLVGTQLTTVRTLKTGQWGFERVLGSNGNREREYAAASFVASWAGSDNRLHRFRFTVAEDYRITERQLDQFSRTLWGWLATAGLILLAAQGTILRWSLAPLQQAEKEIAEIESGHRKRLSTDYPKELGQLTDRLNTLVENSDKHLQRYRDALGNLAHSLKTPLAVLRSTLDTNSSPEILHRTADEQFNRMIDIIDHQLQRAATAGRSVLSEPIPVGKIIDKISGALQKVYASKSVEFTLGNAGNAAFSGDEGDFYELVGNLMDNAYKWCAGKVAVHAQNLEQSDGQRIELIVDDDGPGIPAQDRLSVLQRGKRTDPDAPGHGLGLDMVRETVEVYGGSLDISENPWGGLRVTVIL